jgi:hypothetical protein
MLQEQADPSIQQPELHSQHFPEQITAHVTNVTKWTGEAYLTKIYPSNKLAGYAVYSWTQLTGSVLLEPHVQWNKFIPKLFIHSFPYINSSIKVD